jgi:hypothetical protein
MVRKLMIAALATAAVSVATIPAASSAGWFGPRPWNSGQCDRWACGWRYPHHPVMHHFAPPGCWRTFRVATPYGVTWPRYFICR